MNSLQTILPLRFQSDEKADLRRITCKSGTVKQIQLTEALKLNDNSVWVHGFFHTVAN